MGGECSKKKILAQFNTGPICFNYYLMKCIDENDNATFLSILKDIKDPQDGRDCRGASLLHVAAEYGNAEITKHLITTGFSVDLQDDYGRTALMIALKKQYFSTAQVLLQSNADIWVCDDFGFSALQMAITVDPVISPHAFPSLKWRYPYWTTIAMILDKVEADYSDSDKIVDILSKMHCPLAHVVFMNNSKVMQKMIDRGCSINARNRFTGATALHLAVCFWKLDKVKLLLNCGADVNVLDYRRRTPLMCLYHLFLFFNTMPVCEVELVDTLLKQKPKFFGTEEYNAVRQMHDIFKYGSKDAVRVALESDPDLFLARCVTDHSLLHILAMNPSPGIEEVITGKTMEVDSKNGLGDTALVNALKFRNDKIVECLLAEGARLNIQNQYRITPMHVPFQFERDSEEVKATIESRLKCIKVMLEHGGDPEITFYDSDTILEVVARNRAFALAEPVLAQFAIRQISEIPISKVIREQIKEHQEYKTYFDSRVNELEDAKTSMIWRSVTVFDFLTASNEVIILYARNRGLVSKLTDLIDRVQVDSYYMGILQKRFSKVSKINELRKRAAEVVYKSIGKLYEFNAVITTIIIDYLDDEDVEKLL